MESLDYSMSSRKLKNWIYQTAMAMAKYLPPLNAWTNRYGERTTFSQLVDHLIAVNPSTQSCGGTHILEALGKIYIADQNQSILENEARKKLTLYLKDEYLEVIDKQSVDGFWDERWCGSFSQDPFGPMTPAEYHVLVTGHILGVLHEIDGGRSVPDYVTSNAAGWLNKCISSDSEKHSLDVWLCPFTHAAIAIREAGMPLKSDRN